MDSADERLTHNRHARWPLLHRLKRLVASPTADPPYAMPVPPQPTPPQARPLSVLVVDDDPVNLLFVSNMLASCGIKAQLAADGTDAVALACGRRLDFILMDLQMPVLDGLGATRQIRRFERDHGLPRVPVVAYTTSDMSRRSLGDFGIDDVLAKPCRLSALQQCLQQWCPHAKALGDVPPMARAQT